MNWRWVCVSAWPVEDDEGDESDASKREDQEEVDGDGEVWWEAVHDSVHVALVVWSSLSQRQQTWNQRA